MSSSRSVKRRPPGVMPAVVKAYLAASIDSSAPAAFSRRGMSVVVGSGWAPPRAARIDFFFAGVRAAVFLGGLAARFAAVGVARLPELSSSARNCALVSRE